MQFLFSQTEPILIHLEYRRWEGFVRLNDFCDKIAAMKDSGVLEQ